jgi:O-antigen ligase
MLAVGSVHVISILAAGLLAALVAVASVRIRLVIRGAPAFPLPFIVLTIVAGYTLIQAAPLPTRLLHLVAPAAADVWERALLPFGDPAPTWASLSLDPGASHIEAIKWLTYAAVFLGAAAMSAARGPAPVVAIVFSSALIAALVTLAHGLLGATRLFGMYEPSFAAAPWHVGPLLNPNNLSGYLNLGAFCGLGLLLTPGLRLPSWAYGIASAAIVGVSVTTASRGGVLALILGSGILAALLRWGTVPTRADRSPTAPSAVKWLLGATLVGGATLAVLGSTVSTWNELDSTDVEKLRMAAAVKPVLLDHPWFGIGRGAFESVFPAYRTTGGHIVYTHPENFLAQWLVEWGLPGTLLAGGAFVWAFRTPVRRGLSPLLAAALTGVVILLLQNLADLALEVASVSIAMFAVLGAIWGDAERKMGGIEGKISTARRRKRQLGCAIVAAFTLLLAVGRGRYDVSSDRTEVRRLVDNLGHGSESGTKLAQLLHDSILRHPADPYFPLVGALLARQMKTSPMPWIERSLERALVNPRAHFLLADILGTSGHVVQGLLELRIAAQQDPGLMGPAATSAIRWTHEYDQLVGAVPADAGGAPMLQSMAAQLGDPKDRTLREKLLREALHRAPTRPEPHLALAEMLIAAQSSALERCAGDRGAAELEEHANALQSALPKNSAAARVRASLLLHQGKASAADELLAERCHAVDDALTCMHAWVQAAAAVRAPQRIQAAARDFLMLGCAGASDCADSLAWIGDVMAGRGDWGTALTYYSRAVHEQPTEAHWMRVADASSNVGALAEEISALERVAHLRKGLDPSLQSRIEASRAKAMGR